MLEKMTKISIIIPAFNCSKTIRQTLQSIKEQTYSNYEVLCIYSQSNDDSLSVINEFVSLDERFSVYVRPYEFAALSRNYGIEKSTGDYVLFVDSDDLLPNYALDEIVKEIDKFKADVFCFNAAAFLNGKVSEKLFNLSKFPQGKYLTKQEDYFSIPNFVWGKVFKRTFVVNENISFENCKFGEDVIFNVKSYIRAEKVIIKDVVIYYYRQTNNSATSKFETMYDDLLRVYDKGISLVSATKNISIIRSWSACVMLTLMYFYRQKIKDQKVKSDYYEKMREIILKLNPDFFSDFYHKEYSLLKKYNNFQDFDKKLNNRYLFRFYLLGVPLLTALKEGNNKTVYKLFNAIRVLSIKDVA